MKSTRFRNIILILLTFILMGVPAVLGAPTVITDPMKHPLPTAPEPTILGGTIRVEIIAGDSATGWMVEISSDIDSSSLVLVQTTDKGDYWELIFTTPSDITPDLYDMTVNWIEGSAKEVTQSRSIWVMEEWPETITFSQISDVHQPYGSDFFAQYIHEQNLLNPDMIIVTGDIVDVETIASAWSFLQGTLEESEIPTFLLPGNHDHTSQATFYKRYGGKTNYSTVIGDFVFVALNSHGGGYVTIEELEWADKVLQQYPNKVKIIAFHHAFLSSEYEDDLGSITGGEITGSWENIEDLQDTLYFTWNTNMDNSERLLRLIEENDVRVILNGHVHRDMIYILNEKHYFITTTTLGGGLPATSYHGYRTITVSNTGEVTLDEYAQASTYDPPNSIPLEDISYYYKTANDGSTNAVTAVVVNNQNRDLTNAQLEFHVNDDVSSDSYTFSPAEPNSYKVHTLEDGYKFIAYVDITADSTYILTLSSSQDMIDPEIHIELPYSPEQNLPIEVVVTVSDKGYGVKTVSGQYSQDEGSTWTPIELEFKPTITGKLFQTDYPTETYLFEISTGFETLTVQIEAEDYAGNLVTQEESIIITTLEPEPEPQPEPEPEPEPQPEPEPEPQSEPEPDPESKAEPASGGGIPVPGAFVLIGVIAAAYVIYQRKSL